MCLRVRTLLLPFVDRAFVASDCVSYPSTRCQSVFFDSRLRRVPAGATGLGETTTVLDTFCGVGTAGVVSKDVTFARSRAGPEDQRAEEVRVRARRDEEARDQRDEERRDLGTVLLSRHNQSPDRDRS